jgi:hypothetical protein
MARIIAGRAETQAQADRAVEALRSAGFAASDITSFYLNPPGQHAQYPIGGDAHHDEGTKSAGTTATAGATIGGVTGAALGAAVGAAAEPGITAIAGIAGAGVGAYVGSLAGGLTGTRGGNAERASVAEPVEREAGMMVAVRVEGNEDAAIHALRAQGVLDIERAAGEWRDSSWVDFDPRRTPQLI